MSRRPSLRLVAVVALTLAAAVNGAGGLRAQRRPTRDVAAPLEDAEINAFLSQFSDALARSDAAFLTAHIRFPLPVDYLHYDVEGRHRHQNIRSAASLLRHTEWVDLSPGFVLAAQRGGARSGEPACGEHDDSDEEALTNPLRFTHGPLASTFHGREATVRHVRWSCGAEAQVRLYDLENTPRGVRLTRVRMDDSEEAITGPAGHSTAE